MVKHSLLTGPVLAIIGYKSQWFLFSSDLLKSSANHLAVPKNLVQHSIETACVSLQFTLKSRPQTNSSIGEKPLLLLFLGFLLPVIWIWSDFLWYKILLESPLLFELAPDFSRVGWLSYTLVTNHNIYRLLI